MEALINMVLLTLMAVVTIGVIRLKGLFGVAILSGIYSFLMASVFIVLDAVDVAMTEASVGAGISTVLFLATLSLTRREETPSLHPPTVALFLALVTALLLIYATFDLPPFGSPDQPIHRHVADRYLAKSVEETGVPNVVTSVLASYRGFDTLGEVIVIFTAGIGVILLLKGRPRKGPRGEDGGASEPIEADAALEGRHGHEPRSMRPKREGGHAA